MKQYRPSKITMQEDVIMYMEDYNVPGILFAAATILEAVARIRGATARILAAAPRILEPDPMELLR